MTPSAPQPDGAGPEAPLDGDAPPPTDPLLDPPNAFPPRARRRLWLLGTDGGLWRVRFGIVALAVLGFLAFVAVGANRPADPALGDPPPRVAPPGFGEIGFTMTSTEVGTTKGCAVLAEAEPQWNEGFMHKRALPGYDAMVFRFSETRDGAFYNRNVPINLEIAWFDEAGDYVDATVMPPCEDLDSCPLYRPRAPYLYAIETPAGGLTRMGVDQGSKLTLEDSCAGG